MTTALLSGAQSPYPDGYEKTPLFSKFKSRMSGCNECIPCGTPLFAGFGQPGSLFSRFKSKTDDCGAPCATCQTALPVVASGPAGCALAPPPTMISPAAPTEIPTQMPTPEMHSFPSVPKLMPLPEQVPPTTVSPVPTDLVPKTTPTVPIDPAPKTSELPKTPIPMVVKPAVPNSTDLPKIPKDTKPLAPKTTDLPKIPATPAIPKVPEIKKPVGKSAQVDLPNSLLPVSGSQKNPF